MSEMEPALAETPGREDEVASELAEELARADWYGTLASLWYAPPSQPVLDRIAAAATGGGALGAAWGELAQAAAGMDAETVRDEYERLFIGVGKPEVMLYGSYYLSGFLMEKPLAALRTDLSALGLQRADSMAESEDHIAALCEVMRQLIVSVAGPEPAADFGLAVQKKFFAAHLQPWVNALWDALEQRPDAMFYRPLARVARCYFDIEAQAFDLFVPEAPAES